MSGEFQHVKSSHRASWVSFAAAACALAAVAAPHVRAAGAQQSAPQSNSGVQTALPQGVETDVDGELEVQYEESPHGGRLLHFLNTTNGRLALQFASDAPTNLQTGTKVRVHGTLQNHTLALGSSKNVQVQALPTTSGAFGPQQTIVILVNFQDNTSIPYDPSVAYNTTFQTANAFYQENSFGQTSIVGNVAGWFTLPMNSTTCDTASIASYGTAAAKAAGVNVAAYPKQIFAFPAISACGWWGLADVGGNPSQGWINGTFALQVVAHELGHTFGLYHSHSMPCTPTCSAVEYGDDHDVMADVPTGDFTSFHKELLGWLDYGSSPTTETVTQSGTYSIDQYELPGTGPKALKILQSTDSSGNQTWYYVENRTSNGFDNGLAPGVLVHTGYTGDPNSSYEVDLTPGATTTWILAPGQTFTDPTMGLSITTLSSGISGATLNVTVPPAPCTTGTPTLSLSPSSAVLASPGSSLVYTASVRNTDGSTCGTTVFNLGVVTPSGWTGTFTPAALSLAPGTSGTATLTVGVPQAASGAFSLYTEANRTNTTGANALITNSITVAGSLGISLTAVSAKGGYQLSATVTAGTTVISGATVSFVVQGAGSAPVLLTATTSTKGVATAKFTVGKNASAGTYQVTATTGSGTLTGQATTSFSVR